MEATYKKVFNMAYRLSGSRPDAEDLTQEAFYRAYRSFSDYEGDKPFENWIFRIVTRLFLDLLRSRRRRIRAMSFDAPLQKDTSDEGLFFDVPDAKLNPENELLSNTLNEDLQRTLSSLSNEQRLLVALADVECLPYKEIAEIVGKPIGTIRSRLHRTHKVMRLRMEQFEKERQGVHPRPIPTLSFSNSY
jgi:RNA polymerase sigma-70 factor (ECF subfamily)